MKNRVLNLFVILAFLIPVGPVANADIDLSDNLSPTLVSISLANKSLYPGQKTLLTLVIRDDKNELINLPINIQWLPPSDAPGYIASNTNRYLSDFKILEILKGQGSVQTTMTYVLTAPDWIGNFQGVALQGIMDATRNESSFWDLYKSCDKPINGVYGSGPDGRWPLAFPNIKMNCDFNFSVRAITSDEKEALKAAADKAAADKAAADKAAAAVIEAAKSEFEKAVADLNSTFTSLQTKYSVPQLRMFKFQVDRANEVRNSEGLNLEGYSSGLTFVSNLLIQIRDFQARTPVRTSITCIKGKISKKVTATNPKCPAGYKKK